LKATFAATVQPLIDKALRDSQIVHFARVVVIDDTYIQILTEYDGDKKDYTEYFRKNLPAVFKAIFSLAEGLPPWDQINNTNDLLRRLEGI